MRIIPSDPSNQSCIPSTSAHGRKQPIPNARYRLGIITASSRYVTDLATVCMPRHQNIVSLTTNHSSHPDPFHDILNLSFTKLHPRRNPAHHLPPCPPKPNLPTPQPPHPKLRPKVPISSPSRSCLPGSLDYHARVGVLHFLGLDILP